MDLEIKKSFLEKWEKYFPGSELPIVCYYSDELNGAEFPDKPKPNKRGHTCIFSQLAPVRQGRSRAFNGENLGCWGATTTLGFDKDIVTDQLMDFLINVERYKKTPAHVQKMYEDYRPIPVEGKYLVFKRWDELGKSDDPQVVFSFCNPDVIAALHALANFDAMTPYGVIAPFDSGCGSIVGVSMRELESEEPKAVLGGLDPSMRPYVKQPLLTFSAPWPKFLSMIENMDNSFLTVEFWGDVKSRLKPKQ
jgi:hypothetical protein